MTVRVQSLLHGNVLLHRWHCDCGDVGPTWCNSYSVAEAYGNHHVATSALHSTERVATAEERRARPQIRIVKGASK